VTDLPALLFEALTTLRRGDGKLAEEPWSGLDAKAAFHAGVLEGVALAFDLTVRELLDDPGLGRFNREF
jgi:hypothetical protein